MTAANCKCAPHARQPGDDSTFRARGSVGQYRLVVASTFRVTPAPFGEPLLRGSLGGFRPHGPLPGGIRAEFQPANQREGCFCS